MAENIERLKAKALLLGAVLRQNVSMYDWQMLGKYDADDVRIESEHYHSSYQAAFDALLHYIETGEGGI